MTDATHLARDAKLRLLAFGILGVALAGALALSFVVTPEDIESGRVVLAPSCPSKRFLGIECLSCGMTRAFCALGHGRWSEALDYNRASPLVFAAFGIGAVLALRAGARALGDWRHLRQTAPRSQLERP